MDNIPLILQAPIETKFSSDDFYVGIAVISNGISQPAILVASEFDIVDSIRT